jgi:lipopolysaccharide export system protein LptA
MKKLLLLSLLYSNIVFGLESDADKPITIDANSAIYDEGNKKSTYYGNVISVQGSMRVNSSKLVAYLLDGDVDKLVWTGKPAKFKQKTKGGKEEIRGSALILEYYTKKDLFVLKKNAIVNQGNNKYKSDLIKYDIRNTLVRAGKKNSNKTRVRAIIGPKEK